MKDLARISALVILAGAAMPALAQDSTASAGNTTDALEPHQLSFQRRNYVATMTPFRGSWNSRFGIVPLVKAGVTCPSAFPTNLISAQAHSATLLAERDASGANYLRWNAPGFGVHNTRNLTPSTVVPGPASSFQFGVAFNEFSGGTACTPADQFQDNVVTAIVNFDPTNWRDLYVSRFVAGVNKPNNNVGTLSTGSIGMGGVDAFGNVAFRVDQFGTNSLAPGRIGFAQNYIRVRSLARNLGLVNTISSPNGGSDTAATDYLVGVATPSHNTPTLIPADLAGRSVVVGSNFLANFVHEGTAITGVVGFNANMLSSTAHRLPAADHRGGVGVTGSNIFGGNSVATGVMLGKTSTSSATDRLMVFGLNANGAPTANRQLLQPATVSDPVDAFTASGWELDHYRSQVAFQGGNAPVAAVRVDETTAMAAGVSYDRATWLGIIATTEFDDANPWTAMPVATFDPTNPGAPATWALAAWVNFDIGTQSSTGKPILDGPGGSAIGRLCSFYEVHRDPARQFQLGPNFSAPVFDAKGNIYFLSFVELFNRLPGGASDFDSALIRAVYDPSVGGWSLELVFEMGQVFQGSNSGVPYRVQFFEIVDGSGPGSDNSVGSGTMWSGNGPQTAFGNRQVSGRPNRCSTNMGGLIVNASILYDSDLNGVFDSLAGDQSYNSLLYVGAQPCAGDVNCDGEVDLSDFFDFFGAFDTGDLYGDMNGDGTTDLLDFFDFFNDFDTGC